MDLRNRQGLKIAAAVIAAIALVAIPHLLTIEGGGGGGSGATAGSHRCQPAPNLHAFHVRVRKLSCAEVAAQVQLVSDGKTTLTCTREKRPGGRRFVYCNNPAEGVRLQFVRATGKP